MIAGATPIRTSAKANVGVHGRDDDVARCDQADPAGSHGTVECRDHRLRRLQHGQEEVGVRDTSGGLRALEVRARAEDGAVRGEHDRPDIVISAAVLRWAASSDCRGADRALRFAGESRVIVATPSARSRWTSSVMIA